MGRWIVVFTLPLAFAIAVEVHPVPQTSGRQNTRISRKVGRGPLSRTTEGENFPTNTARQDAASATYLNVRPGVAYLGSQACAPCHKDIYDSYMRTSMAQAMSLAMQFVKSGRISLPITVFDKKSNRYYQVLTERSDLYQSIYRFDADGKTIYRETEKVFYVIGTGRNGMGFLVRRGNYLLQAPLAYFPRDKTWELSPGYESFDFGFTRPVSAECVTCHSGIPQPVAGKVGLYQDPSFRELGIGCEKCHGPGQLHVTKRQQGQPLAGIDRTIVNPARLSAYLANDICIFGHEAGDARVLKPGKSILDFRPGTPLDNTVAVIESSLDYGAGPAVPLVGYHFQLQFARCFRESGDRLKCLTCHDPHIQPAPAEAASYYRKKCLQCHTDESCRQSLVARLHMNPSDDCISCHMTTRPAQNFTHTIVTDHRIIARPNEPYPESGPAQPADGAKGLILVNRVPNEKSQPLPPDILLQAYDQLLASHPDNPQYQEQHRKLLDELAKTERDNPDVLRSLARVEAKKGTPGGLEAAIAYLQRAFTLGSVNPNDRVWLAQMLFDLRRGPEAVKELTAAIALSPYSPDYYRYLAVTYITDGKYRDGMEIINRAAQLFPESESIHVLQQRAQRLEPSFLSHAK